MNMITEHTDEGLHLANTTLEDQQYIEAKNFVDNFIYHKMSQKDKQTLRMKLNAEIKPKY
jgi:hypothetical protein